MTGINKRYSKKGFTLNRSNRLGSGFTLIEIIVVVAIIGILATIIMVSFAGAKGKSNYTKTLSDMNTVAKALSLYNSEYETYPGGSWYALPVGDARVTKYISTWPSPVCKNYVYYYTNDTTKGVGLYFRYSFITNISIVEQLPEPVIWRENIAYLNISNLVPEPVTDNTHNLPNDIVPISISDVPNKSFICDIYKTGF